MIGSAMAVGGLVAIILIVGAGKVARIFQNTHNDAVEECARVAEKFRPEGPLPRDLAIAAAIRALKDKP